MAQEQAEAAGAEFIMDTVEALEIDGDNCIVRCRGGTAFPRRYRRRRLQPAGARYPWEERLLGKGKLHIAPPATRHSSPARTPVSSAAATPRWTRRPCSLSRLRASCSSTAALSSMAQQAIVDKVTALPNIEPLFDTEVVEILGDDSVTGAAARPASGETDG
jgi:hypothetical protein